MLHSGGLQQASTPATDTNGALRMNHIQVIGTHNSYHREISLKERAVFDQCMDDPQNYYYSHSKLSDQLSHQSVRSLELDLHSDLRGGLFETPLIWKCSNLNASTYPFHDPNWSKPGYKVFHVNDMDTNAVCHTLVSCLEELKAWSDANPRHIPILIDLEMMWDADLKTCNSSCKYVNETCLKGGVCDDEAKHLNLTQLLEVDREIRSVLPAHKLIVPDNVRKRKLTLEESILQHGWPTLDAARGKFMFYFDNEPDTSDPTNYRNLYRADGHDSLQGRVVWTNSLEGDADAAFIKHNTPTGDDLAEIQRLVKKGYIVRTRADEPITTVQQNDTTRRHSAFVSGAQIVSTDYPAYGMSARWDSDYVVQLEGGIVARCNPVTAPEWCKDSMLE
ncbi:hypothetical protein BU16DRAFT_531266 [Lophium mytilinum]|uniref:PLC-like phosphodiesterase n=1 Tax=Lophium mytilinum TaxID=390894 RepID=A0A6A6QCU0_9PEZI|nr:hypothetical protein BU16DRAFT_531266 [Lophium mytilinum]